MMKNKEVFATYLLLIAANIVIMTAVFKFSLAPVLELFLGEPRRVSIVDAMYCAVMLMALRGMFIVKIYTEEK